MAKGGAFELELAKKLSLWFTEGKRDDLVCRTDTSGGRATVRVKNKKETNKYLHGDLKHSDDECRPLFDIWSIEAKTGYASKHKLKDGTKKVTNWDLLDLLDSKAKEPLFVQFWNQCILSAELTSREPILIFRRNQKEPCVAISNSYFFRLKDLFGPFDKGEIYIKIGGMSSPIEEITVIRFNDFLEWIDAKSLIAFNRKE